jgi:hypothetical protein
MKRLSRKNQSAIMYDCHNKIHEIRLINSCLTYDEKKNPWTVKIMRELDPSMFSVGINAKLFSVVQDIYQQHGKIELHILLRELQTTDKDLRNYLTAFGGIVCMTEGEIDRCIKSIKKTKPVVR